MSVWRSTVQSRRALQHQMLDARAAADAAAATAQCLLHVRTSYRAEPKLNMSTMYTRIYAIGWKMGGACDVVVEGSVRAFPTGERALANTSSVHLLPA